MELINNMNNLRIFVCCIFLIFLAENISFAQINTTPPGSGQFSDLIKDTIKETKEENTNTKEKQSGDRAMSPLNMELNKKYSNEKYFEADLKWELFKFKNAEDTFAFHYWSSLVIFILVIVIVGVGLLLTWKQVNRKIAVSDAEKANQDNHEFSIGKDGIKIKSSIVGILILSISLAFFYLYLRHVYPVSFVGI